MLKAMRIVLFWLLAFTVPVQGFAATTMLFCMGSHHQAESAGARSAQDHHAVHEHSNGSHHEHHDMASDHGQDLASSDGATSHEGASVHKTAGKCSACSACCMSVAIPTSAVRFEPMQNGSDLVAVEFRTRAVFLTDGPERPPRSILA